MTLRIRQIALVAQRLDPVLADLRAVLGIEVCYRDPGVARFGLENALLPIGNQFLEVVAPTQEGTAGGRYLERRGGDGGYMVITQCDDHALRRKRVDELCIRIVNEFEVPGHFRNMQLHPKDTGGSFFEIDQELGERAGENDGPWHPAGGAGWKAGQRLDVVTGIAAAEIQADKPETVAARWSEVAEIGLTRDAEGNALLPLDGSVVRFVSIADGRPEGLGGIDVSVADRARLLAAAKARGCYVDDSEVRLCGMRVRLVEG